MKFSLEHLPEKNQFEINHIVEIIREVVNPEMVILFGSYAKGKQVNHKYQNKDGTIHEYISDYDFLVVVDKVTQETSDQEWLIEERADMYDPPVNLEIHEVNFINHGLETGQYFFTDILSEGVILFDSGTVKFSEPRQLTAEEQKIRAHSYYSKWFVQASNFLKLATISYKDQDNNSAAFLLHQATESLYYTILLVYTGYKPKTHNLKRLRKKAKQHSAELFLVFSVESNKKDKQLFELLKQGYIDARYKLNYNISGEEVREIIKRVEEMKRIVENICSEEIS